MGSLILADRVVVIIGGTSGLGLSATRALCAAGGWVVAVGMDDEYLAPAASAIGDRGIVLAGDARLAETAAQAVRVACEQFGRLDGLYHVAGGSGRRFGDGPLHEVTDAGLAATLELNLMSVIYSNRAAVQQFLKQGTGGTVLNLTSVLASSPAPHYFATHVYAAAKAAIVGLTKSAAAFYAPQNIRFNALAAGLVATPMSQRAQTDSAIMRFVATKQPLDGGRIGQPADLDGAAVYFLSDQSRFATGQLLQVDGGWSVSDGEIAP